MQLRRLTELALLTACLSAFGCQTFNEHVERCTVNVEAWECYCHTYQIGNTHVGKVGETVVKSMEECDRLIGVSPDDWVKMYEALRRLVEDSNNSVSPGGFQDRD